MNADDADRELRSFYPRHPRSSAANSIASGPPLVNGCLMQSFAIIGLWFLGNFISAMIGLFTGTLYLWGKGGTLIFRGVAARIIAALILLFGGFLAWQLTRKR